MGTGFRGTFVISWSQTEVDGFAPDAVEQISVGATWRWQGQPVRVDGPPELLRLENTDGHGVNRKSAARMVRRLVGAAMTGTRDLGAVAVDDTLPDSSFVVTNGAQSYTVSVIDLGRAAPPLLMFIDEIPPQNTEMWVVHHTLEGAQSASTGPASGGVICFTPGTRIETPEGPRLVEEMREGDRVQTKDNGADEIQWIGSRRMTGARLFAMPKLRPIRISAGALGAGRPDAQLLVSPEHRMLVQGDVARALFNTPEVLISAKDLINSGTIKVDLSVREVTYIHLLLPRHQIIWANGLETESFHPASAALSTLEQADRLRLLARFPSLEFEPQTYGAFARRSLSSPEAAILAHEAA
ncbi:hemolysin-type calcium-binding protein [Pelagivirga sediminicola]|uniref:Hemolysin-type calcium-binding protein n=1 Tax=Pelagivirga sediminicola TaxID=2170575 RepID=A0A2T7G4Z6_9RHOB|nr:Hint domain-containing protein [Pelagivirga sediminicola]PVA09489.1 hemolysin-type calcium-binding protein [Pelagivirga sediminicola]